MFDSAWCLVMTQIQFTLIKKKIGRSEHLLLKYRLRQIFNYIISC